MIYLGIFLNLSATKTKWHRHSQKLLLFPFPSLHTPTPVFLPGKFHRKRSRVGYSPWGHKESDTTELRNNNHTSTHSVQPWLTPEFIHTIETYNSRNLCSFSLWIQGGKKDVSWEITYPLGNEFSFHTWIWSQWRVSSGYPAGLPLAGRASGCSCLTVVAAGIPTDFRRQESSTGYRLLRPDDAEIWACSLHLEFRHHQLRELEN